MTSTLRDDAVQVGGEMIFFTTHVTVIRRHQEQADRGWADRGWGTPARVEGSTVRLPAGTDIQVGDFVEHRAPNDELHRMVVIDAVYPYMLGASKGDDQIELTCAPLERVQASRVVTLHPAMSAAASLLEDGRMTEAVREALRLVEQRVESLAHSDDSGHELMESVFGSTDEAMEYLAAASLLMQRLDRVAGRLG